MKYLFIFCTVTCISYGILFAAPRTQKQQAITRNITLNSLNIVTLRPGNHTSETKKIPKRSIHNVCKRINQHKNHHVIDTIVSSDHDYQVRITSGAAPIEDELIFVYSGGWAGYPGSAYYKIEGQALYSAYVNQKAGVIPGVCVCFDHITHTRSQATFGQLPDQYCLQLVLQEVRRVNPQAAIVLIGSCSGAMTVLNFIAEHSEKLHNIQAIILESPSISIEHIEYHIMSSHLGAFGKNLPRFFNYYFSSYNQRVPTILATAHNIPSDLPILIGAITHDKTASYSDIQKIVATLGDSGHCHVHLYSTNASIKHGQMGKSAGWVAAVHEFFYNYGIICKQEKLQHE